MEYEEFRDILNDAWEAFFSVLEANGITEQQCDLIDARLNNKDCFNDVNDCVAGVVL